MYDKEKLRSAIFNAGLRMALVVIAVAVVCLVSSTQAQTYRVIYTFSYGPAPVGPRAGLSIDAAGNLYGTTVVGGGQGDCPPPGWGCGTVFQLTPTGSGWVETTLHGFNGTYYSFGGLGPDRFAATDGIYPTARPIVGSDGSLYGTTSAGASGSGTVYQLTPSGDSWTETVVHRFTGYGDGGASQGDVVLDAVGNLYATTGYGGTNGYGTVFQLTRSGSGWTKCLLYSFQGGSDGARPGDGVIFDSAGNLYGVTGAGGGGECLRSGPNCGTVFQLMPSGSGWTEKIIHNFHDGTDGGDPTGLVFDHSSNLLGTICESSGGGGAVFMLSPSGGAWNFHVLHLLTGTHCGLQDNLAPDAAGNIYGTTFSGGAYGRGSIFKLAPQGGGWTYTELHHFTGNSDGGEPNGSLIFDRNGNLYGTTQHGGQAGGCGGSDYTGCGVVFELTP